MFALKIKKYSRHVLPAALLCCNITVTGQNLDINATQQQEQPQTAVPEAKQVQIGSQKPSAAKRVRNLINDGNSLYNDKRYSEAAVSYNKALEIDPVNETALFNLASSLLQSSGNSDPNDQNSPANQAIALFHNLTRSAENQTIVEKSFYNLGNIAYNKENYGESIEMYKNALRRNPLNNNARENLRLAQLKKQQQDQNKNNQDNQDEQQQQQKEQKQDQDKKEQQNQQNQQQQNKQQQQQNQQQQQMSDSNAERILKAMENQEAATRKRVEAQKAKEQNNTRRQTEKPW